MTGARPQGRRAWRLVAAVLVAGLALGVASPALLRGPVARWAFARATASLCGSFAIGGGRLGWAAVFDLALGRPIPIAFEDVRILGPDGKVVLLAARLEATLQIQAFPWRITIDDALVARGRWRLAIRESGIGSSDAFRAVPDRGRAACLDPRAARPVRRSGGAGGALTIRRLELEDVDTELDFPSWGLRLDRANAAGSLALGGAGPPIVFDARDVIAVGGQLRIGRSGDPWTAAVPFDAVAIERVAVTPERPTDLELDVAAARTGRARLGGQAIFTNIFPTRVGAHPSGLPGLHLDARWKSFASALSAIDAVWRPRGAWAGHLDGDLTVRADGPFVDLASTVEVEGGGSHLTAHLGRGVADLDLAVGDVDTSWMLDPALWPLLGGRLRGRLRARARLAPTFAEIGAEIIDADLRLDRRRARSGPRRFELRMGGRAAADRAGDTLVGSIRAVRLADATLTLDDLRLDWTGLSARAGAVLALPGSPVVAPARRSPAGSLANAAPAIGPADPGSGPRSRVEAQVQLAVAELDDWLPGVASGPLKLSADARGTLERIVLGLGFPAPATLDVLGQRYRLPARVAAVWAPRVGLDLARFRLERVGGGAADVRGRIGAGGGIAATVRVAGYPVDALPGLGRVAPTGALRGTLGADLTVGGFLDRPTLDGRVDIAALAFRSRPIGDAHANVRFGADAGQVDLTIDPELAARAPELAARAPELAARAPELAARAPELAARAPGVAVRARLRRRPAFSLDAEIDLRQRDLGPWLPGPLAGAPIAATGQAKIAYRADAPLVATGTFELAGPGLEAVELAAEAHGLDARARLRGGIDVARWPSLWSPFLEDATGSIDVDVTVAPGLNRPRLSGHLAVARSLALRTPRWPSPISLAAGGRVEIDGDRVTTGGLSVSTAGATGRIAGRVTLDREAPSRSPLAVSVTAALDAETLPVRLPAGVTARGHLELSADVAGTLAGPPGPRVEGQARFDDLAVRLPGGTLPTVRAWGVVKAHGDSLEAEALRLQLGGVGTVTVGGASPARVQLISLSPLRLGRIDVSLSGQDLTVGARGSALTIQDLDADVRLAGDARGELALDGDLTIAGGSYDPSRAGPSKGSPGRARSAPWYRALPPHLALDLRLHGARRAMRVSVPLLPDVGVGFECRLVATNRGAALSGGVRGDGAYAGAAIGIYGWLTSKDLRRCQIGTP